MHPVRIYTVYTEMKSKTKLFNLLSALGELLLVGLLSLVILTVILIIPVEIYDLQLEEMLAETYFLPLVTILQGGVFLFVTIAYLSVQNNLDKLRVSYPSKQEIKYIFIVTGGILTAYVLYTVVSSYIGIETADHTISQASEQNPLLPLIMIPVSLFVIGVWEEVVFRGFLHEKLRTAVKPEYIISIASVIFAILHVGSYESQGIVTALLFLFLISCAIGIAYEKTRNLIVPILIHGLYDAVLFAVILVNVTVL